MIGEVFRINSTSINMNAKKYILLASLPFVMAACQSAEPVNPPRVVTVKMSSTSAPGVKAAPGKMVHFRDAVVFALNNNPRLKPYNAELRAADGRILQASLKPNPTLDGEIENILGSGEFRGFDAAESTLAISQLIERGGKRLARRDVERMNKLLILSDYEIARREVFTEVAQAYAQTLAAQEKVDLYGKLVGLNESFLPEIEKRIEAGKVPTVELTRARTAVTAARLSQLQAKREFRAAKLRLAATWGSTSPVFDRVAGRLADLPSAARQTELERRLYAHPAYRKGSGAIAKSEAEYRLARAKGVQDVTISGGVRNFRDGGAGDVALVVGFSIPLPFRDRNQGEIVATEAQIEAAKQRREATIIELKTRLNTALRMLQSIRKEVTAIQKDLLPDAEDAFQRVEDGYRKGRFGYLDLIEARRSLTEARVQLLAAKAAYHESAAEISGLTAPLPDSSSK